MQIFFNELENRPNWFKERLDPDATIQPVSVSTGSNINGQVNNTDTPLKLTDELLSLLRKESFTDQSVIPAIVKSTKTYTVGDPGVIVETENGDFLYATRLATFVSFNRYKGA